MSDTSDFDVQLVNSNLHEFYVRFRGPEESAYLLISTSALYPLLSYTISLTRTCTVLNSPFRRWRMANTR